MNRRDFLRTAGGAAGGTAALAASGSASAAEDGGSGGGGSAQPDFGSWLSNANLYGGSTEDLRGQSEVTISVGAGGGFAFDAPAIWVDTGTTITWEWTGEGGAHNVISDNSDIDSGSPVGEAGTTYEFTVEEGGIYEYYCSPHKGQGMKGAIAVGGDVPTVQPSQGGGEQELHEMGVPIQAHFVGIATILAIGLSLVFTFFMLKYGESAHTKGGNN